MKHAAGAIALVLAGLAAAPSVRAQDDAPAISMTVSDGRLSLDARSAPLQSILNAIGDRTGVRVRLDEPGEARIGNGLVTIVLDAAPVEDALRRLLRGTDFVLVYSPGRLAEARVYGRNAEPAGAETAPPAGSVDPVPAGEPQDRSSVAGLRSQVLGNPDPAARARALEGLAASADQRAVRDTVLEVLERESNPGLLQRALDIAGGDRSIPLEPIVKLAVGNPAPEVRIKALTQLREHVARDPRARQTLEVSAADDPAPGVRQAARALLQQMSPN